MVAPRPVVWFALLAVLVLSAGASAQQKGSIRGVVYDKDFDAPMPGVEVQIVGSDLKVTTSDQGDYVFGEVDPGTYDLVYIKDGYTRELAPDVVVTAGQLTDVDMTMSGEFVEMDEFIVQELEIGGASEAGLLRLRVDSPALLDSIGSELMLRAGASDAADALRLVSGASLQDGKFAVVRGLPDRYVSSQLNGVRLPSADEDTRAVQLDQFPRPIIESIQVSKTFTPDQQGDASGGAVNIVTRGLPTENVIQLGAQIGYNSQVRNRGDFLTYRGGGVDFWARDKTRNIQTENIGGNWDGAVGVSTGDAPTNYKFGVGAGLRHEFDNGVAIGGYAGLNYKQSAEYFDNGVNRALWQTGPGEPLTPEIRQADTNPKTALFDVTQGTHTVQWGAIGVAGLESENHDVSMLYLYNRIGEDQATLAEDTSGKEFFFGPGYDPDDPTGAGNTPEDLADYPYLRTETLRYQERTNSSLQFTGKHTIPIDEIDLGEVLTVLQPKIDWTIAKSTARQKEPDKRQFGGLWLPPSFNPGFPPFVPSFTTQAVWRPFKPDANFTLGNVQRIFKNIQEDSDQWFANVTLPFTQWTDDEGFFKIGYFDDKVDRKFDQETFSNFNDNSAQFFGEFEDFWSAVFPDEDHPITGGPPFVDVDYRGKQRIKAWYAMADVPVFTGLNLIGGARMENTDLSIVNLPEEDAVWFPPGALGPVRLNPGDADVDFDQDDVLPSFGFVLEPIEGLLFRGSWSETIARATFKELTPIVQQEFLGGPIFIGNPDLRFSSLTNYDLRLDYAPYDGGLFSLSWFKKDIKDPIEFVQRVASFNFTTPVNYPEGEIKGWEFEIRQDLGYWWENLEGFSIGANATFIDSEVLLPLSERELFASPGIEAPIVTRDATGAPEYLLNLFMTYDNQRTGTQVGIFYTSQGDTLLAGATVTDSNFVPNIYGLDFHTLNLTMSQQFGEHIQLVVQAKNLTNPEIQTVYRSDYTGPDVLNTSFTKGIELTFAIRAQFTF